MDDALGAVLPRLSDMPRRVGHCFVPQWLINEMVREADARAPLETGGVLLGVADAANVWIDTIVGPGPSAQHTRTSFIPDADYQSEKVADAYRASGRRLAYLGDWHTHPGGSPRISWRDRRTLRLISHDTAARQSHPIMFILGYGDPWSGMAWRYTDGPWYRLGGSVSWLSLVVE
jgi:integrative and conjugative element protein (TIGR02256 family)